jgi:hypothetical protein
VLVRREWGWWRGDGGVHCQFLADLIRSCKTNLKGTVMIV